MSHNRLASGFEDLPSQSGEGITCSIARGGGLGKVGSRLPVGGVVAFHVSPVGPGGSIEDGGGDVLGCDAGRFGEFAGFGGRLYVFSVARMSTAVDLICQPG